MNILVTGCSGYIGSHICKDLSMNGHTVFGIDLVAPSSTKYIDQFYTTNYNDIKIYHILTRHNIKKVIHTAATSLVGPSIDHPEMYYNNNAGHMISFLSMCKQAYVDRIVYSSSAAVYGNPNTKMLVEDQPLSPCNPYGKTKLFGEWALQDYATAYGIEAVALRYFNVCGADPDGEFGQVGLPTHIITVGINAASSNSSIKINGNDYDTKDGTCIRDYVHVTDVAVANRLALDVKIDKFEAINIGSGIGRSNLEIVDAINKHSGLTLEFEYGPRRVGDPDRLVANISKAKDMLSWHHSQSGIIPIVKTAVNWNHDL